MPTGRSGVVNCMPTCYETLVVHHGLPIRPVHTTPCCHQAPPKVAVIRVQQGHHGFCIRSAAAHRISCCQQATQKCHQRCCWIQEQHARQHRACTLACAGLRTCCPQSEPTAQTFHQHGPRTHAHLQWQAGRHISLWNPCLSIISTS